jgi:hypothetical protein
MRKTPKNEADVARDDVTARSRATGGVPDPAAPDQHSTTGTTPSEEFVGRVAGQDVGAGEDTGAERRAEAAADGADPTADDPTGVGTLNPEIQARLERQ